MTSTDAADHPGCTAQQRKPFDPLKTAAVSKAKLEELTGAKESLSAKAWNTGGAFSVVVPYTIPGKLTPFWVEFGGF